VGHTFSAGLLRNGPETSFAPAPALPPLRATKAPVTWGIPRFLSGGEASDTYPPETKERTRKKRPAAMARAMPIMAQ
jgi:hypothetical protein